MKHTTLNRSWRQVVALSSLVALGACGGGSYEAPPPPADPLATVPDSARQTVSGLVSYLDILSKNPTEGREAIDTAGLTLPSNEDGEPAPL